MTGMPQEAQDAIMDVVRKALAEGDVQCSMECGVAEEVDFETGTLLKRPTDGRTITIKVNGGAVHMPADPYRAIRMR